MSRMLRTSAWLVQGIELPEAASMRPDGDADMPGQPSHSQADVVFAQPLEELDPSDTEQEKVMGTTCSSASAAFAN